jgi:Seed maturation protein
MQDAPETVTTADAAYLESRESRAMGGARPPANSISADAKRLASASEKENEDVTVANGSTMSTIGDTVPPKRQSALAKEANFQEAAGVIGAKVANDPASVSKEDAALLARTERRAHGVIEKGGIAAQAQRLASKNEQEKAEAA